VSRTPAKVTQADVARCIRAARSAGAGLVEVRPDGTIFVHVMAPDSAHLVIGEGDKDLADEEEVVL
jgi:hypothetical protein